MSELPPLDQPQAHVVVGPNDQRGPYTLELLITEVLAGRLSEETPVWWPGLNDWTTMGAHPGVAGELARRRGTGPAPAWAEPAADPYGVPAAPYAAPGADPYAAPAATQPDYGTQAAYGAQPNYGEAPSATSPADPFGSGADPVPSDDEPVDAEIIEVVEVVEVDPEHVEIFTALVARSSVRAETQRQVDAVNDALVSGVSEGVTAQGFALGEQVETDRTNELRFDGAGGDLVVASLGRAAAGRPDALREDHVPITLTYRSAAQAVAVDEGSGAHGDVVVASDEWTGQSTSSVSLFLGLSDYLDDALSVDTAAVARDVSAAVAVLRSRLA
jgi:hypothetical protein